MTDKRVSQFFDRVREDEAVQGEYRAAIATALRAAVPPAIVGVATKHGYDFTEADVDRYLGERAAELSDRDLESISAAGPSSMTMSLASHLSLGSIVAAAIAIPAPLDDGDGEDGRTP